MYEDNDPLPLSPEHPALREPEAPLLVVGIGAGAGGRPALQEFLAALDETAGMTLVIVLQPEPDESAQALQQLQARAPGPLSWLRDGDRLCRDRIYALPADSALELQGRDVRLTAAQASQPADNALDRLFRALAESYGPLAVGMVLSGAGTDGSLGAQALSNAGGMLAVQDPAQAQYDSMPRSAIATGLADHVQSASELAQTLLAYAGHVRQQLSVDLGAPDQLEALSHELPNICECLRQTTQHDFRHYKASTLMRRIRRRMQVMHCSSPNTYVELLRANEQEVRQLFRDLLIGVTAFFRDPQAFEVLRQTAIDPLLAQRRGDALRVWVPGCATGEEAYSLAIVLHEALQAVPDPPALQLFATDIDEHALSVARRGVYPAGIAERVSEARLARYFIKRGKRYQVTRELRDLCLFTPHNVINDPPFSRLDLVSCRNLLIYFGPHLQAKLVPLFHYALRPKGFLFLGSSESLASHKELFCAVDLKHRVFQRRETAIHSPSLPPEPGGRRTGRPAEPASGGSLDLHTLMQRMLLDEFAPRAVVVSEEGTIVSASGEMERYLTVSQGTFQNHVVRLARPGLRLGLRSALAEASKTKRKVLYERALLPLNDAMQHVRIVVQPMPRLGEEADLYLVVFEDLGLALPREAGADDVSANEANGLIEQLESELEGTRDALERAVQELEVANEELKSTNEELISMNEELQSANEELETSRETSLERNRALSHAHAVLSNLMSSTAIATIFLDEQLRIQSFTPLATQIYNIKAGDVGRPLAHLTHHAAAMPPLPSPDRLSSGSDTQECDIQVGERSYLRRVHPYTSDEGKSLGLVVNFMDVTELKRAVAEARYHRAQLELITDALPVMISYVDANERYRFNNAAYEHWFGLSRTELSGRPVREILGEAAYAVAKPFIARALSGESASYEAELDSKLQGRRIVHADYVPDVSPAGTVRGYFSLKQDVTERREAARALAAAKRAAEVANLAKSDFLANMSHEIRTPMSAILGYADLLLGHVQGADNLQRLEAIRRNGRHLMELLNDILDLSKIEAGMLEAELLDFDPAELIREVVESTRPRAQEHGLSLELSFADPLPQTIKSDPTRLRQVLLNLLSNAIKFTPQGGVRVSVVVSRERNTLEVAVADTGIGVPDTLVAELFEPFTQADNSITRRYGGTGLGLTITKRLVHLLGGQISVANNAQAGATFRFSIATGPLDAVPLKAARAARQREPVSNISLARLRVLIVDDLEDMRSLLQTYLEQAGASVITACNGLEALQCAAQNGPFDAIVLDMQMPELDGFAAASRLREAGYRGMLLALTASAMKADRERCIAAGCDEYMSKPVNRGRLLELLASVKPRDTEHSTPAGAQRRAVLVVDDNADAAEVLTLLLARQGDLELTTASSGAEALQCAAQLSPAAVVLDIGLPDMDGYALINRLKQLPGLRDSVFIALTGRNNRSDVERARAAGFHHHFVKPPDVEALRRAIGAPPSQS